MLTILSINLGVFGYLVLWGVALDPISMTTLLMSIGFSVDFTSHISFHYYTSTGNKLFAVSTSAFQPFQGNFKKCTKILNFMIFRF